MSSHEQRAQQRRRRGLVPLPAALLALQACVGFFGSEEEPAPAAPPPVPVDEGRCGDAITQRDLGELCDEGTATSTCSERCRPPRCGDGLLQADRGESCDDGDGADGDESGGPVNGEEGGSCTTVCTPVEVCGNGTVESERGEECDAGAANDDLDGPCTAGCTIPRCGDGVVQRRERCDPGGAGAASCSPRCTPLEDRCGAALLAAGGSAVYVVRADGALLAFGAVPGLAAGATPTLLPPPAAGEITGLAAGDGFVLVRMESGALFGRGANEHGQLGQGHLGEVAGWVQVDAPSVTAIAAGREFGAFLAEDRQLWSFGSNEFGKLGRGMAPDGAVLCPADDPTFADCTPPAGAQSPCPCGCAAQLQCNGAPCVEVACGANLCAAPDCPLEECRAGQCGAAVLGNCPQTVCVSTPGQSLSSRRWLQVTAGAHVVAAIREDGRLHTWGRNRDREAGRHGFTVACYYCWELAREVEGLGIASAVAAGPHHVVAVDPEGALWGFGRNDVGQLGPGDADALGVLPSRSTLAPDPPGTRLVSVAAGGGDVSYAIDDAGAVYSFGENGWGQAGPPLGGNKERGRIELPQGELAVQVAAGKDFAVVRAASGRLYSLGYNDVGQLGRSPQRLADPTPTEVVLCP